MPHRFETRSWAPYPVELVFAFFANPENLPRLMPGKLGTRIEDARIEPPPPRPGHADPARRFLSVAAGVGSEILISFFPFPGIPRRVSWTARITEFEWYSHFCDVQVRGPFRSFRHRHGIHAETRDGVEGTLVTDSIEYQLPYGVLGHLAGTLVGRMLAQSFEFRRRRLPEVLAVAARQPIKRA